MVQSAASPGSPVTIRVSAGGGGGFRGMGLTSPVPRPSLSNNPHSPAAGRSRRASSGGGGRYSAASKGEGETEVSSDFVHYTVHIPPTPDHPLSSASVPERSYVSGTIFTGGFNSVTRGHVMDCSTDDPKAAAAAAKSMAMVCAMNGCDGEVFFLRDSKLPCECGFMICKECYLECAGGGRGHCPGCKEPYRDESSDEDDGDPDRNADEEEEEEEDEQVLPLASMAECRLNRRLSLMRSTKIPNHNSDFDHTRWLYETKGTYGYGNAVWPKTGYAGGDLHGCEDPPNFALPLSLLWLPSLMADDRERLLPPKSSTSSSSAAAAKSRESAAAAAASARRPLFQGMDFLGLKKRGQGLRSWIRVDAATGSSQIMEVDKFTMMRRCDLPARDLRLLDPLFVYPSTILGREKAIVVNLEQIRCIITADEVLLLNSLDSYVLQYVVELQRKLSVPPGDAFGGDTSPDYLPFEFRALEVALEAACTFLDGQAAELEIEAYPLLDELTSKISTLNLERVRRLKSRLVALTRRVQKVRDEIEQLMDDDGDMAEMYLTEKKRHMETSFYSDLSHPLGTVGAGQSVSAPVSPVSSPPESRRLEKTLSITRSRHDSMKSSDSNENIEELEMLLEAYFVVIDSTLNKLTSLKEYIDDTEDFINIQLDNVRNQLIQFELLLTTATFVVAIFGVVAGVFGMNFPIKLFDQPGAFEWVLVTTGVCGVIIFCSFLWFFKYRRLMPL